MSSGRDYLTLARAAVIEHVVQKSRFIASAAPIENEEAALAHLRQTRLDYKAASHYCYAYIVGENAGIMRYQDDGEPSGTAGVPILESLRQNKVVNACVVVTRYFGGVLLGAGGLTRAYSQAASQGIKAAGLVLVEQSQRLSLVIGYPHWDKLEYLLRQRPVTDLKVDFSAHVTAKMVVRQKDAEKIAQEVRDSTLGEAMMELSDAFPWQWPAEGI